MAIRRDSGLPVESTELRFFKSSIPDKLDSGFTCNKDNVFTFYFKYREGKHNVLRKHVDIAVFHGPLLLAACWHGS